MKNVQYGTRPEETGTSSRRKVSSLCSTDKRMLSDESEFDSRLKCLGSNLAEVPLPDVTDPAFDVRTWAAAVLDAAGTDKVQSRQASFVFKDLDVSGSAPGASVQPTVASMFMAPLALARHFRRGKAPRRQILNSFDGVVNSGELLLVLGRPGSGCSTFLRTITGQLGGIEVGSGSTINYCGLLATSVCRLRTNKI